MLDIAQKFQELLDSRLNLSDDMGAFLYAAIMITGIILIGLGTNWILQAFFRWGSRHFKWLKKTKWHIYLSRHQIGHHIMLLVPGAIMYVLPHLVFEYDTPIVRALHRAVIIYMLTVVIMIINAIMLTFLDIYSTTDKNKVHPLKGLIQGLQVILYFIGGIIIIAVLLDKSPTVLLTGLGASAAVLMLIFKDSILGFVAGVQLSQNNMVRIGDWIQTTDGSANGNVEEITLNTIKVRNWDNTITMIPPYTLVSTPFKNWRGMQESGGRRVDKQIYIDINSLENYTEEMVNDIRKNIPLMADWKLPESEVDLTNIKIYREYIERYLRNNENVNVGLDLIITEKESTPYGLPIQVYFFTKEKAWAKYETQQSDIFDHLMMMAPEFGLKIYQRP